MLGLREGGLPLCQSPASSWGFKNQVTADPWALDFLGVVGMICGLFGVFESLLL